MSLVYAVSLAGAGVVLVIMRNGIDAFVWWSETVVFFALVLYSAVNLANLLYFAKIAPQRRSWFTNVILPVTGIGLNLYVIYRSFLTSLWGSGFRLGQSVVLACFALLALFTAYTVAVRLRAGDRFRHDLLEPVVAADDIDH
jgi:energy-converting hydrogenase Eha subunit A